MKNKKMIILVISFLVVLGLIVLIISSQNNKLEKQEVNQEQQNEKEEKSEEEKKEIQEIKEETGATGKEDIYELQEEPGGRKVLAIKPSIQYQVAFAGAVLRRVPTTLEEAKKVAKENELSKQGIWITKEDRETFITWLNEIGKNSYTVTQEGYLTINQKNGEQNEIDQMLERILAKEKQIVITMTGVLMTVDPLTGEMMDNPFAQIDAFQPYDYVKDGDRIVISLNDNRKESLTKTEILESVIRLLESE